MGGRAEVKVVGEDDVVIGERELYVVLVDGEDVAQLGSLQLLQQGEHAWSDLLEQMRGRGQHLEDCLTAY